MDIIEMEQPHGVIVSTGGQIPNNLAMHLDAQNVPILGTAAKDIDNAEDRAKFSQMLTNNAAMPWSLPRNCVLCHRFSM